MPPRREDDLDEKPPRADLEKRMWGRLDPNDPEVQIWLLAQRIDALTREKEELERRDRDKEARIAKMEKSFNMGAGMLILLPVIGTAIGIIATYAKVIFKPWSGP